MAVRQSAPKPSSSPCSIKRSGSSSSSRPASIPSHFKTLCMKECWPFGIIQQLATGQHSFIQSVLKCAGQIGVTNTVQTLNAPLQLAIKSIIRLVPGGNDKAVSLQQLAVLIGKQVEQLSTLAVDMPHPTVERVAQTLSEYVA